jgi:hypothetical protein
MDAGSVAGDNLEGSGALPTSSILVDGDGGELENDDNAVRGSR